MVNELKELKEVFREVFPGDERVSIRPNGYVLEHLKKADIPVKNLSMVDWYPDTNSIGLLYMEAKNL